MAEKKNIGNDHRSVKSIQALMETAQTMTACRKNLQQSAETLVTNCYTQGTKGEAHRSLLLENVDGMRSLAELYESASKKFENTAMKLLTGIPEDKVLADMIAYGAFFQDQLDSENNKYESVLNILQENTT